MMNNTEKLSRYALVVYLAVFAIVLLLATSASADVQAYAKKCSVTNGEGRTRVKQDCQTGPCFNENGWLLTETSCSTFGGGEVCTSPAKCPDGKIPTW